MEKYTGLAAVALILACTEWSHADYITFVPPNDPTGAWYAITHDNGPIGRGVVFQMNADTIIDAVSSLPGSMSPASLQITEVTSLGPNLQTGATILRSGSFFFGGPATPGSSSLWGSVSFAPLLLQKGHDYHVEIIQEPGTQEFLFNNNNVPFSIGAFGAVDGTYAGFTYNSGVPAIQVHVQNTPEPNSLVILGIGALGIAAFSWRRLLARA